MLLAQAQAVLMQAKELYHQQQQEAQAQAQVQVHLQAQLR